MSALNLRESQGREEGLSTSPDLAVGLVRDPEVSLWKSLSEERWHDWVADSGVDGLRAGENPGVLWNWDKNVPINKTEF